MSKIKKIVLGVAIVILLYTTHVIAMDVLGFRQGRLDKSYLHLDKK